MQMDDYCNTYYTFLNNLPIKFEISKKKKKVKCELKISTKNERKKKRGSEFQPDEEIHLQQIQ